MNRIQDEAIYTQAEAISMVKKSVRGGGVKMLEEWGTALVGNS